MSSVTKSEELALEQNFFDHAYELREGYRERVQRAPEAAANKKAASDAKRQANATTQQMGSPSEPVAMGRMDFSESGTLYVGMYPVWDEGEAIVASWKSPVSRAYYEAGPANPLGLTKRRRFSTDGNRVLDFEELILVSIAAEIAALDEEYLAPDSLLKDLERHRTGEMQNIVRTIQAEQSRLMREPPDQLLVVQGGPGTGKSAIGLHRASWILFQDESRIGTSDLLIVGPSQIFIRYINKVLPGLGDRDIAQLPVAALSPTVKVGGEDSAESARLKGDLRMRSLVDRALQDRVTEPTAPITFTAAGSPRSVSADALRRSLPQLRLLPYADGRSRLRDIVRAEARLGETEGGEGLEAAVETVWPQLTAQSFLRDLWGSESRLLSAAGEDFSAADVRRLYRRRADRLAEEEWTAADLPVLDYADNRIRGGTRGRYAHIIIDEAQDLSPMQLAAIARRSATGAYTVIGDLAQSTGQWARDSWDEVLHILAKDLPVKITELENGYRVPAQIFEFASQLLPWAAPSVRVPRAVRLGPSDPDLRLVGARAHGAAVVEAARNHAGHGLAVGIICPDVLQEEVREALDGADMAWTNVSLEEQVGSTISLLLPTAAKGLEFEAVIVVEPEEIVRSDPQGLRLLFVALTRATKHLTVVHSGAAMPVPGSVDYEAPLKQCPDGAGIGEPGEPEPEQAGRPTAGGQRIAGVVARDLASQIRAAVSRDLWDDVLATLADTLHRDGDPTITSPPET